MEDEQVEPFLQMGSNAAGPSTWRSLLPAVSKASDAGKLAEHIWFVARGKNRASSLLLDTLGNLFGNPLAVLGRAFGTDSAFLCDGGPPALAFCHNRI